MGKKLKQIQTERLILRGIDETDTDVIVKWRSDPAVYQYFRSSREITVKEHLRWFHTQYLINANRFEWMCMEKDSGKKVGVFGLIRKGEIVEVNYLLALEAQHKGYAGEAVKKLQEYAGQAWKVKKFIAVIHKDNASSLFLAKHLGYKLIYDEEPFLIYGMEV